MWQLVRTGLKYWLHSLPARYSWENYWTELSMNFLTGKMKIIPTFVIRTQSTPLLSNIETPKGH